jgi:hypothetical protein
MWSYRISRHRATAMCCKNVLADLTGKGVVSSEHLVRVEMDKLMDVARCQIMEE